MIDTLIEWWIDEPPPALERVTGKPPWVKPELVPIPSLPDPVVPSEPPPPPQVEQPPGALPVPAVPADGSRGSFLAVVMSQVGWVEPGGSNAGNPWGQWDGPPWTDAAYCGQFVGWAFDASGVYGDWRGEGSQRYVPNAFWYWARNGQIVGLDQAQPGDIALLGWADGGDLLDHMEVIVEYRGNGVVATVGGNTGSPEGVHWTTRDRSTVLAVARPEFAG